ncbi:MAG: type III-A CRISPR-associated RAMP protein Csm5 [Thermodesulfobacteriota bacterium]
MTPSAMLQEGHEVLETRSAELEVISPVHIGTREGSLSALEFVFLEGKTFIVDEDRLGAFLRDKGLIEKFVESARNGPLNLKEFIRNQVRPPLHETLSQIEKYSVPGGANDMRDFRPFVRDGMRHPYLPGTAIKGVCRTAVLYDMLAKNAAQERRVQEAATNDLRRLESRGKEQAKKRYSLNWLQEDLLERYSLANAREGSNRDLLRCLKVSDSYPMGAWKTKLVKIEFLSKRAIGDFYWSNKKRGRTDTGRPLELWVEALVQGTFKLDLSWDRALFKHFSRENAEVNWPVSSIDDVISALFRMSKEVINHEIAFFHAEGDRRSRGKDQRATSAAGELGGWYKGCSRDIMRIGFGSGMLSTTVNLRFPPELRQKIRDLCGHPRPGDPAPKSRRIWNGAEGKWYPMGWVAVGWSGGGQQLRRAQVLDLAKEKSEDAAHAERAPLAARRGVPITERGSPIPVGGTREHRQSQVAAPEIRQRKSVRHGGETLALSELKRQADIIRANDKLALERIVKAIENLKDEDEQKEAARYIKEKLEKVNLWKKHPMRFDIEAFLSTDGGED